MTALVWFRKDLRLADNPAWAAATSDHDSVRAVFVLEPRLWERAGPYRLGQLRGNLVELDEQLQERGGRLQLLAGPAATALPDAAAGHEAVYWNADYSPFGTRRDGIVAERTDPGIAVHHGSMVHAPGTILTNSGAPFRVFTPFYRRWADHPVPGPVGEGPAQILDEAGLPIPDGPEPPLPPGEAGAMERLGAFASIVDHYGEDQGLLGTAGGSRLSIDLKFGTLSPGTAVRAIGTASPGRAAFVRQLAWREFYAHAFEAEPAAYASELRPEYAAVPWRDDPDGLAAWKEGRTGYPLVDAGMRQLRATGWMPNRVRMVTASFLVKDLLIDWREGERHFRHWLIDADPSQNVGNWQWVASTGFDAAPYFRIMNPVTQSKRHDPDGSYIRRWVPELRGIEAPALHSPWDYPLELAAGGVSLGADYPYPIVDHGEAREQTLDAYKRAAASG